MFKFNRISQSWLVIIIVMTVLAMGLLIFRLFGFFTTGEAINVFLIGALVLVTAIYARETTVVAKATREQAELLRQQQHNAVAPVIELEAASIGIEEVNVGFSNIGLGPALNFRCWIEDEQYPRLRTAHKGIFRYALGRGDTGQRTIATGIGGYKLGVGYIRAQYEDVFGRTYESCLIFPANALPELKYGIAKDKIVF